MTLVKVEVNVKSVAEKYRPNDSLKNSEKSIWTENRLQGCQSEIFKIFKVCGKKCDTCTARPCDAVVSRMVNYLIPYGESIYKRAFKFRSTLEEMNRVLTESINAQLMELWDAHKVIHTSFGSMLRWKMIHFLDGKLNLFDKESVRSIDQIFDSMQGLGEGGSEEGSNSAKDDMIEKLSEAFVDATSYIRDYHSVIGKNTIEVIINILAGSNQFYSRFLNPKLKYAIYIRTIYGVNRFFQGKKTFKLFDKKLRARFYYTKILDTIFRYLEEYKFLDRRP